jgi:GT2 family glycosyltransferase
VDSLDQDVPANAPATAEGDAQVVPPVVIVLVVDDPGSWFDATVRSLAAQTYANASVLVIDVGSDPSVRERVARRLPDALVRDVDGNPGYGAACNEALNAVQGAAFYLFCHDDIRLDNDTLQVMVEEAFRSNAGIVGPKLVDWHRPDRLLSVGMGADKTGYPAPNVERGELDQEQHDRVRDTFYVPGAATLVRADLFSALGGYDAAITFHGDDLDLCWRAQVAGARVVTAPDARIAHLEALGSRRPIDDRRRLQMRHRLRAMRVSYTWWTRARIVPQAALLALLEMAYSVVLGRFRQARDVGSAWVWNARHRGGIRRQRRALAQIRRVPDREVRNLQVRGSARLAAYLRGQIGSTDDRLLSVSRTREVTDSLRSSKARTAVLAWLAVSIVLVLGSRDLLFGNIAAIGDMPVLGDSARQLVREWFSGYRSVGLGAVEPNPTGLGFIGGLGLVFLNALGLLTKVLVLATLPVGAAGIWRLTKPIGSRRSRIVALLVYVAVPVPYNAIAGGQWNALVIYAVVPWVLGQLANASGLAPYGDVDGTAGPGVRSRPLAQRIVAVGVLTGVATIATSTALVLTPALAIVLVVGGLLAGTAKGAGRVLAVGLGGSVVAFLLQLPWSISVLNDDPASFLGATSSGEPIDVGAVLRFETGPLGSGLFSFLFLAAAGLALVLGRSWRLGWAVRAWALVLTSLGLVFVQSQGWGPVDWPATELLLVPAAAGVALAAAMGMAAFEVDLPDYHFGWRQILSVLAGAALVLSALPVIGATVDGRWDMPRGDYARALSFIDTEGEADPFRVLWMGDQSVLPLASWPLDEQAYGLPDRGSWGYGTSDDGTPELADRWPASNDDATAQLGQVLAIAGRGGTSRLGSLLAPMGVRYIVVPIGPAPEPYSAPTTRPESIVDTLDAQLDLSPVTAAGVVLYRNNAWGPTRALLPAETQVPSGGPSLADRFFPPVQGAPTALPDDDGPQRFSGEIDLPSEVYLAEAGSDHWNLDVDGASVDRDDALGWANVFHIDPDDAESGQEMASATLRYQTPIVRYGLLLVQIVAWLAAVVFLLRVRVVRDEGRSLDERSVAEGDSR